MQRAQCSGDSRGAERYWTDQPSVGSQCRCSSRRSRSQWQRRQRTCSSTSSCSRTRTTAGAASRGRCASLHATQPGAGASTLHVLSTADGLGEAMRVSLLAPCAQACVILPRYSVSACASDMTLLTCRFVTDIKGKLQEYATLVCGRSGPEVADAEAWAALAAAGTSVTDDKLAQVRQCNRLRACNAPSSAASRVVGSFLRATPSGKNSKHASQLLLQPTDCNV